MCACVGELADLRRKISSTGMQPSRAAAVGRSTLGRGGRKGAVSRDRRGRVNVDLELCMRDGLIHQKQYFCLVLVLLLWCGGFGDEALVHADEVLRVLALLARALGLDTHFFELQLFAIRRSKRGGRTTLFHFVDAVFEQWFALLALHLLQ
jgi:hypothetical protein